MKMEKLWGGRFEKLPSKEMVGFLSGRDVKGLPPCDDALIPYDLWGSPAHVIMLCHQGILSKGDGKKILKGLRELETLFRKGKFKLDPSKEDVHNDKNKNLNYYKEAIELLIKKNLLPSVSTEKLYHALKEKR